MEQETQIQKVEPESPLMNIISVASTNGEVDADKLMKLIEANERYLAGQAKAAYHVAMAEFQANAPKIIKKKDGHNCKYAGLSDIVSVIAPLLSENGLSHSWVTDTIDSIIKVTCKITHKQGHSEEVCLSAGADTSGSKNSIQALGSTVTYLQRYTLKAVLGLAEADQGSDGAGSDPGDIEPTAEEAKVIEAICNKMLDSVPEGLALLNEKVAKMLYGIKGIYPSDPKTAGTAAAYLINRLTENKSWNIVTKKASV